MKAFLQTLLVFLCFALCGLIAFQWLRETRLRAELQPLREAANHRSEEARELRERLHILQADLQRLEKENRNLTDTLESNRLELATARRLHQQATHELQTQLQAVETLRAAVEQANLSIQEQNRSLREQRDKLKALAADRDQVVKQYNEIVRQYNDLVEQHTAVFRPPAQPAVAPSTPAPAKP